MKQRNKVVKVVIFDLDGVLIDSKKLHFEALNLALAKFGFQKITYKDHLNYFDGLSTNLKLDIYSKLYKKISLKQKKEIHSIKQKFTFSNQIFFKLSPKKLSLLKKIKRNFKICLATNSIKKTLDLFLKINNLTDFFDFVISNNQVKNPKPHSEIYLKTFIKLESNPDECLIIEDSPLGRVAAYRSGSNVLEVENLNELTYDKIINKIDMINNYSKPIKWKSDNLNILIPMSGMGSRFAKQGFIFPKPLVEINQKPMIQVVIDNLNIDANYIFIVQEEHCKKFNIDLSLKSIQKNCTIIKINEVTEGAACSALLAKKFINNETPLLIANSDQFIEWKSDQVMYSMMSKKIDGAILTFNSSHPKWSYAKIDTDGYVKEVAEKKPISKHATVGIYYWNKGESFVQYAEQMIKKNIRTNNEFYICPVFNEAILDNKKIIAYEVEKMWGLGTPEDLNFFTNNYSKISEI